MESSEAPPGTSSGTYLEAPAIGRGFVVWGSPILIQHPSLLEAGVLAFEASARLAAEPFEGFDQAVHLIVGTDGDTHEVAQCLGVEVSDQDGALTQSGE